MSVQGWLETRGHPGQAIGLAPPQTDIFFKLFWSRIGLMNIFFEGVPKLLIIFREIPSRVENLRYQRCISNYSSDVLELHVGHVLGNCLADLHLRPALCNDISSYKKEDSWNK